MFTSQLHLIQF